MNRAYVCLTSDHIVARSLAFLRSLERVGSLKTANCFMLCFDDNSYEIIRSNFDDPSIRTLRTKDIPSLNKIINRPIAQLAYGSKPFLLDHVIKHEGMDKVIYIDSDTWFISDFSFIFDYLDDNNILLIPAVPDVKDSIKNWELVTRNAQKTGYYNAGFIGCNTNAKEFIDWWLDRCTYSTSTDYRQEIHGDQKYLNWVPSLFPKVHILRNHGLNVKNYSAQSEILLRENGSTPMICKDKIVYFHFSQNMGNLLSWPNEFYPEVSKYLMEIERARIVCGKDYVDMSYRANKEIIRPLLPRSGPEFKLLKIYNIFYRLVKNITGIPSKLVAKGGKLLPIPFKRLIIKRYISKWFSIVGDLSVKLFPQLFQELSKIGKRRKITFWGISGFAMYLSYFGKKIQVIDPFQGYYNPQLDTIFNPQYSKAIQLSEFLGINTNLQFERIAFSNLNDSDDSAIAIISSRLGLEHIKTISGKLAQSKVLTNVVIIYNSDFSDDYKESCRSVISKVFSEKSMISESYTGFDIMKMNKK